MDEEGAMLDAKKTMRAAFARLTPTQRTRLAWHAKEKTGICCGKDAWMYAKDGAG